MTKSSSECVIQYFIVSPPQIHLLRFILEAYEGMAVVTTLQPELGLVQVSIAPGCEEDVRLVLQHEEERLHLRPIMMDASSTRVNPP